jgi:hypothetical protein
MQRANNATSKKAARLTAGTSKKAARLTGGTSKKAARLTGGQWTSRSLGRERQRRISADSMYKGVMVNGTLPSCGRRACPRQPTFQRPVEWSVVGNALRLNLDEA